MGYYTDFSLDSYHEDVIIPDGLSYDNKIFGEFIKYKGLYDMKWYRHIDDILKVSLVNPNVIFRTSGVGEENGDQWKCIFLNGKYKKVVAEIVFKNFKDVEWCV